MSQNPEELRAEIERTRSRLSGDVDELSYQANPKNIARRKVDDVKSSALGLKDRVMGAAEDSPSTGERVSAAGAATRSKTRGNPLAAGLIAFGAGLLVGGLIPASRQEQQAAAQLKESAGPVKQQLTDAAKDVGDNLREPAQDAVSAVKDSAGGAVDTVRDEGQQAVGAVQDQAVESKEQVQQSRQN